MTIYLDHNATTPPAPEVVEAMVATMVDGYGNAGSAHAVGRAANARVEEARASVSELLGVKGSRVIWTSGATEALNAAIAAASQTHPHIVVSPTEHKAVIEVVEHLEARGARISWMPVTSNGNVSPDAVWDLAPRDPFTLVAMAANNETGVLNDVASLAEIAHSHGGLVVCDATQQVGKLPVDLEGWCVDYAAASAHKLYGPQGVGALIVPAASSAAPLIRGGGQQRGWRSGTLNVAGIVGFGVAARLAQEKMDDDAAQLRSLRDVLLRLLRQGLPNVVVNGGQTSGCLPNTLNLWVPGVDADALISNCPRLAFSSGSACTSAVPTPSHVLRAMGLSNARAEESIRLSLGRGNTRSDIEQAAQEIIDAAMRIRRLQGVA